MLTHTVKPFKFVSYNDRTLPAAGIEAVAPDGEKYTKPKGKERAT